MKTVKRRTCLGKCGLKRDIPFKFKCDQAIISPGKKSSDASNQLTDGCQYCDNTFYLYTHQQRAVADINCQVCIRSCIPEERKGSLQ